jgi:deoxyribodipyrimidine photo-lyase
MSMDKPLTLVWMRRDLRLHDHAALHHALKETGTIQPVFIFDSEILTRFGNRTDRRLTFLAQVMLDLDAELHKRGGGMLVLHGPASEAMPKLVQAVKAQKLVAAADIEGPTRARDAAVATSLEGIASMHLVKDCWLQHGPAVTKKDGMPYHVFTPYAKAWRAQITHADLAERAVVDQGRYADIGQVRNAAKTAGLQVLDLSKGLDALLGQIGYQAGDISAWSTRAASARLNDFAAAGLKSYSSARNMMAEEGTSRLSPYIRHGLLSIRECARMAWDQPGAESWINELIWRDFYAMILYHYPETAQEEFVEKYRRKLEWRQSDSDFMAWREGRTGYPVVDAAMRQLLEMGWMHNRARMIVASFMTKHLRLDWRLGEEHFAQHLMDYDLASNIGGWQWASSTGTDAQPYFRIFNPMTQGERFDPDGEYVRRYVPELARITGKKIHQPWGDAAASHYPDPIVNHADARAEALQMFKQVA